MEPQNVLHTVVPRRHSLSRSGKLASQYQHPVAVFHHHTGRTEFTINACTYLMDKFQLTNLLPLFELTANAELHTDTNWASDLCFERCSHL